MKTTDQVSTQRREPIAIVGIGCRYPGAKNARELWELLIHERNEIREIPKQRFDIDAWYDPRPATPGRLYARKGGFLDDASGFDTDYFGMSPREAARMDPQQRMALEVSAEALDDAFFSQEELAAHVTGVYMGAWSSDWECHEYADRKYTDAYTVTGSSRCLISGRISYVFDLRGPSLTVDAGCSASMIAAHLACQSLWLDETSLALVGGVNLVLDPWQGIAYSQGGMMAHDGQCKAFSKHADGLVRSDGCGVVVLMPLSKAQARGARIYAVIRGSGASNDGFSNELLTTPSEIGQEFAIREAYRCAGLSPNDVQYVEAHGTGTRAGDPVEMRALAAVMRDRPRESPCLVGSIKSNIGHPEGASGIAGLIKGALMVHHRVIPKTLFCEEPTPHVDWDAINVKLASRTEPWPDGIARAGVSSFGISGTDVHMVLEESPRLAALPCAEDRDELLVLSAMRETSLAASAQAMCELLAKPAGESGSLRAISYTAALGRRHHQHRLAVVGRSRREIQEALEAYGRGEQHPALAVQSRRFNLGAPVFVFAGQGPQWPGMGKQLFESEPVFRAALQACDEALRPYVDWSLLSELQRRDASDWPIGVIQPSIFAVQVALCALWRSWGVVPSVVVGHSMGEVAAAHVAGVLSLDHAAHIIARRAQNLQDLAGLGGMLAVELPLAEAEAFAARYAHAIGVAANNSPDASVLSGDLHALSEVARELRARDVFCRELKVDAAAHSPQLDPLLPAFEREIDHVRPNPDAQIPICSTVTGALLEPSAFTAAYWVRNQREPVRFATAVQHLMQQEHGLFLEIGPHPALRGPLQQIANAAQRSALTLGSMKRDEPERATILGSLGQLHALGQSVNLRALYPEPQAFVALPGYAWQHDPFDTLPNFETGSGPGADQSEGDGEGGTLGEPIRSALHPNTYLWRVPLAPGRSTYLADHVVQAAAVLPGAAYVSMSLTAAAKVFGSEHVALEQLEFATALVLPADATTQLQIALSMEQPGLAQIAFYTAAPVSAGAPARWTRHARGCARLLDTVSTEATLDRDAVAQRCEAVLPEEHFSVAAAHGFDYGPAFRGIQALWTSEREALAKVVLPASVNFRKGALAIHPAVLDACWQALAGRAWSSTPQNVLHLPIAVERVQRWREPGTTVWAHARVRTAPDAELVVADVQVFDEHGALAIETRGFEVRRLDGAAEDLDEALYELAWEKQPFLAAVPEREPSAGKRWLVLADREHGVAAELCALLERSGAECLVAYARQGTGQQAVLDPTDAAGVKAWITRHASDAARPLDGVVQLWALDAVRSQDATNATLDEAQALGVVGATHVFQALTACALPGTKLWLVTAGAQAVAPADAVEIAQAPLWALGRVLRYEAPEVRTRNLDLGPLDTDRARRSAELEAFAREIASDVAADQLALRGEERSVLRLRHAALAADGGKRSTAAAVESSANYVLGTSAAGVLDNLALYEMERLPPGPGEVEIEVSHAGLNFIDVMKALGIYPGMGDGPVEFGRECVGTVSALGPGVEGFSLGQRVVAMLSGGTGCFSRFVRCHPPLVVPCPERLASDEAAALPCVYLTAYYAMHHLGRLAQGERVLIHSAAGGVGLAAIELARRAGAEIYATAGSHEKREFLRTLGVQHVFDSRSNAFAAEIMQATAGEGVDMVLNSLAGEAISLSLALLRDDGRFLEIGKRDIYEDMQLGLSPFKRGLSFSHIDLARLGRDKPQLMGGMLRELMDLLARGELPTLPLTTYSMACATEAFHFMAQAKHIGKIVLSAVEADDIPACVLRRTDAPLASADATYLVTGGLGGLGLLAAEWLVAQGARQLVLTGRSAPSEAASAAIARMEARAAKVRVVACDIGDRAAVAGLIRYIQSELPVLRGIVHGAGVLVDGLASQLTPQQFAAAMWPKLHGAFNLHRETEGLELDFFVLFSSAASMLGSPGQGNYAAGNEFMDALAHHRRALGLPALSINWGAWSESGMAARPDRAGRLAARGMGSITNRLGVRLLEHLVRSDRVQTAALPGADFRTWCSFYPASATGMLEPLLREAADHASSPADESSARAAILAAPPEERPALLETFITDLVRRVLRIPAGKALDPELPLNRFGVDSLMAIELKNRLEADLGVSVQVSKILLSESLRKFAGELLALLPADARGAGHTQAQAAAPAAKGSGLGRVLATDEAELLSEDYFVAEAGE